MVGYVICVGVVIGILLLVAWIPPSIARARGNVNADAIAVCAYVGIIIWPCWLIALIWAFAGPDNKRVSESLRRDNISRGYRDPIPPHWTEKKTVAQLDDEIEANMNRQR